MHLDRVDYDRSGPSQGGRLSVRGATFTGFKRNGSSMLCFAIRQSGRKRDTLIEVGQVYRLEIGKRIWDAGPNGWYEDRVRELDEFIHNRSSGFVPRLPASMQTEPKQPTKPLWRRILRL